MKDILDLEKSIQLAGGREKIAKEIITMFLHELPNMHAEIKQNYQTKDYEKLASSAHKLKGSAGYCVVPRLKKAAADIELAIQHDELDKLPQLISVLNQEVDLLQVTIKNIKI